MNNFETAGGHEVAGIALRPVQGQDFMLVEHNPFQFRTQTLQVGAIDIGNRTCDFSSDQIHSAKLLYARRDRTYLFFGEECRQDTACIDKTNQGDVPGIGNLVGEQYVRQAREEFASGVPGNQKIARRPKNPQVLDGLLKKSLFFAPQNAPLHQSGQRMLLDRGRFIFGQRRNQGPGIAVAFAADDSFQHPVDRGIVRRLAIDDHQPLQIGVYPVGKCQFHQYGARQGEFQCVFSDGQKNAFLIVQQKQHHFFRE